MLVRGGSGTTRNVATALGCKGGDLRGRKGTTFGKQRGAGLSRRRNEEAPRPCAKQPGASPRHEGGRSGVKRRGPWPWVPQASQRGPRDCGGTGQPRAWRQPAGPLQSRPNPHLSHPAAPKPGGRKGPRPSCEMSLRSSEWGLRIKITDVKTIETGPRRRPWAVG